MDFKEFTRKPFDVEAVEITEENFDEIFALIGREIKEEGDKKWIIVERRVLPNINKVTVGWWLTKMGENNFRCYSPKAFSDQFESLIDEDGLVKHNVFDLPDSFD